MVCDMSEASEGDAGRIPDLQPSGQLYWQPLLWRRTCQPMHMRLGC